jgi:hypothetical protein
MQRKRIDLVDLAVQKNRLVPVQCRSPEFLRLEEPCLGEDLVDLVDEDANSVNRLLCVWGIL